MCAQSYEVLKDEYNNQQRLNLFQFDGAPQNPMWLAYSPTPQMLPTKTLNPTDATGSAKPTNKAKRGLEGVSEPLSWNVRGKQDPWLYRNADFIWWTAVGMTAVGGASYFYF